MWGSPAMTGSPYSNVARPLSAQVSSKMSVGVKGIEVGAERGRPPGCLLSAEDEVDAAEDECDVGGLELSDALAEDGAVDGDDLGDVRDGVAWEPCSFRVQQDVAGCGCPAEVAGERDDDNGGEAARVEGVALDDDDGSAKAGPGS